MSLLVAEVALIRDCIQGCWLNYALKAGTKGRSRTVSANNNRDVVRKDMRMVRNCSRY